MEKHVIKKFKKEGSDYDTYTVFNNIDTDLKNKIASFKLEGNTINMGWPSKKWTVGEKEGEEYKCTSGKNVQYFSVEEVEESLNENLEIERNMKYQAHKHFKNTFGIISHLDTFNISKDYVSLSILDLKKGNDFLGRAIGIEQKENSINTLTVQGYETFYEYKMDGYKGLNIELRPGAQMLNIHFTPEGDFINRDYNEDLSKYECKEISPTVFFDIFKKAFYDKFKGIETFEFSAGKYFTGKECIIPYTYGNAKIGFEIIPVRHGGGSYQHNSGDKIIKHPTKVQFRTADELFNDFLSKLTPVEKCLLSDDYKNFKSFIPKKQTVEA